MRIIAFLLFLTFASTLFAQNDTIVYQGQVLFRNYCAACHHKDMKTKIVGPGLGGAQDRWSAYPKGDLIEFIRNMPALIEQNHPKAIALYKEYGFPMIAFPDLSKTDVEAILSYVDAVYKGTFVSKGKKKLSNLENGQMLYKKECAFCHNPKRYDDVINQSFQAPNLIGVEARWSDYPKEDLINYIRSNNAVIAHPKSAALKKKYKDFAPMGAFSNLSDKDINDILLYIRQMKMPEH